MVGGQERSGMEDIEGIYTEEGGMGIRRSGHQAQHAHQRRGGRKEVETANIISGNSKTSNNRVKL